MINKKSFIPLICIALCLFLKDAKATNSVFNSFSSNYQSFDVEFFLLGMFDNYQSRNYGERDSMYVESFYSNQNKASRLFELGLKDLIKQKKISTIISIKRDQNGSTYFSSLELASHFNAFFKPRLFGVENTVAGSKNYSCIDKSYFIGNDQRKLSYLVGVLIRN